MSLKAFINGTWKQIVQYIPAASDELPLAAGEASAGTSDDFSRADHVHPPQDVPSAGTATPLADGTAAVGTSEKYAREDHVHPAQDSGGSKVSSTPKSSRTTTGSWTISGLVPYKPVYFCVECTSAKTGAYMSITSEALSKNVTFPLGYVGTANFSATEVVIPTGTSLTVNVGGMNSGVTIKVYQ